MEGSERKRRSHDDQHLLEGPFDVESGPGYVEPSSLHKLWRELKHFARKELFGMSLRARRVLDADTLHFEAVGRSRLLILERKFPETGGQHFMTLCKI